MAGLKPTAQLLVGRRRSSEMLSVGLLCASVSTHFHKKSPYTTIFLIVETE